MIRHNATKSQKRKLRVRGKIRGTAERPRLTVYRSNKHISLQVIDDTTGLTLASATNSGKKNKVSGTKTEAAAAVAKLVVDQLKTKKVSAVVFDRGSYRYHGRIKAVAEQLRALGVEV